jgi:hypothetical protein
MRCLRTSLAIAVSILLLVSLGLAQAPTTSVPNLIRYGGVLKDAQSAAVSSATAGVTFAIYNQQDGGAPVWMETQNVITDAGGNYSVLLGSTTATGLPSDLFSQQEQRWLGVQPQGQAEQPRVLLVSVPYALKAHEAETLGGKSVSDFVLANPTNSAASANNVTQASSTNTSQSAKPGTKTGAASAGPTNFSGSTTDQIVGVTQTGAGLGVNATAGSRAIYGTATGASGAAYGVVGVASGTGGVAVFGSATSGTGGTVGVKGGSSSTSGVALRGTASATTGNTIGVSASVASAAGTAAVLNNTAGGKIISGQNNGAEQFSVDGSGNVNSTAGTYRIGGNNVLSIGSFADGNLFLGVGAGSSNVAGTGVHNTFSGYLAGYSNTVGYFNTFSGYLAGFSNTTGGANTFYGFQAGFSNTTGAANVFSGVNAGFSNTGGYSNAFIGNYAGFSNSTGFYNVFSGGDAGYFNATGADNVFSGYQAGYFNTTGTYNTFSGYQAGYFNTAAVNNVFSGYQAGYFNTTGNNNTFLGYQAGLNNQTGNNDVYIANGGPTSGAESSTIRIGTQGTGAGQQNATYIAGIAGSTVTGVAVNINTSTGQMGVASSSLRFKEQVRDMGDSTSSLMKLRPVTFFYKPEYDKGPRTLQYGLIAEEVAKVYPELVAYDNDGKPFTVRYQYIATMLLNEVQKQYRRAEAQSEVIEVQAQKIDALEQRLSRLEKLVGTQVQTIAQK